MAEQWTVKAVDGVENTSAQEKEQAVVEEAVAENPNVDILDLKNETIKVDLDTPPVQEEEKVEEVKAVEPVEAEAPVAEAAVEEVVDENPIEVITEEAEVEAPVAAAEPEPVAIHTPEVPLIELPENVDKLVNFLKDNPGSSIEDYSNLNKNYDDMNPVDLINEFYRQTKPHLDQGEIEFLMDDKFSFNEEDDEPREVKKKQLAFKEELFDAKNALNAKKDKYYAELKLGKQNLTPEQLEAQSHYQEHKKSQIDSQKLTDAFQTKTNNLFNEDFKGFDFNIGESKYRFKVGDVESTKTYQSDLNNLIGEFLGDDGSISDVKGYHKAIYAAKNVDRIAQHFYDQGRAEAIKQNAKDSKNINMDPRSDSASVVKTKTGTQYKVVSGDSSKGLRFRMKK